MYLQHKLIQYTVCQFKQFRNIFLNLLKLCTFKIQRSLGKIQSLKTFCKPNYHSHVSIHLGVNNLQKTDFRRGVTCRARRKPSQFCIQMRLIDCLFLRVLRGESFCFSSYRYTVTQSLRLKVTVYLLMRNEMIEPPKHQELQYFVGATACCARKIPFAPFTLCVESFLKSHG